MLRVAFFKAKRLWLKNQAVAPQAVPNLFLSDQEATAVLLKVRPCPKGQLEAHVNRPKNLTKKLLGIS